ncbi:unnamed protein product [Caenorhabditis auriculariae]|uniref:Uncharacterized protein n=1 Tax=Caenorhabditis auriculariae TaxID=2777116 RepID=A0A8S1H8S1_9PELO|nr:unnamed protein product [Caenorhabditis auriculariae]
MSISSRRSSTCYRGRAVCYSYTSERRLSDISVITWATYSTDSVFSDYHEDLEECERPEEIYYQAKNQANSGLRKKYHHRVKNLYYDKSKFDGVLIKQFANNDYSIDDKMAAHLTDASRADEMDYFPEIPYSVNRMKRWELKEKPERILRNTQDTIGLDSYVVERHSGESPDFYVRYHNRHPNISRVHYLRKPCSKRTWTDDEVLETVTTQGNGQKFNHFRPESRELSTKKKGKLSRQDEVRSKEKHEYPACVIYSFFSPYHIMNLMPGCNYKYFFDYGYPQQRYENRSRDRVFNLDEHFVDKFVYIKRRKNRKIRNSESISDSEEGSLIDLTDCESLDDFCIVEDFNILLPKAFDQGNYIDKIVENGLGWIYLEEYRKEDAEALELAKKRKRIQAKKLKKLKDRGYR